MEGLLKTDIPSKLSGSRNKLPWINTELKRQIRKKGRRFSKAKKSGLKEDWDNYKAMEKDVKCNLNSLSATGDIGRQPPLLPPRLRATTVDTIIHNYRLSAAP